MKDKTKRIEMKKRVFLTISFTIVIIFALNFSLYAVPGLISYQGKFTDADGNALTGSYQMTFLFYETETDGVPIWNEVHMVEVINGIFNVHLGAGEGDPLTLDHFTSDVLYLEIQVYSPNTDSVNILSPRQRVTSTTFAMRAGDANTLNGSRVDELEESTEIVNKINEHKDITDAHHSKTTSFMELHDTATDAQIPDDITVNYATQAGDAHTLNGRDASEYGDGHSLDADDGDPVDAVYVNSQGNVGIGTHTPNAALQINGAMSRQGTTFYGDPATIATHINLGVDSTTGSDDYEALYATISGGIDNLANHEFCTVSGGRSNIASNNHATVSGGGQNTASGLESTVLGGGGNLASGNHSIAGGQMCTADGYCCTASGGRLSKAMGYATVVAGGIDNMATYNYSVVSGGHANTASGHVSTVSGGELNTVSGFFSSVPGGQNLKVDSDFSWAGGRYMHLTSAAQRTFVWGYSDDEVSISTPDAFIIYSGNVGIGKTNPQAKLDVEGTVQAHAFDTGDIVFRKNGEKLWRMFEGEQGLYLESLKTGETSRIFLEKDIEELRAENQSLRQDIEQIKAAIGL
ncbi:MAG: hypothetical protein ACMUIP_04055 [bacterium]